MTSREEHVYLAKLCEQAERYDEMVQEMDHVAKAVRFCPTAADECGRRQRTGTSHGQGWCAAQSEVTRRLTRVLLGLLCLI